MLVILTEKTYLKFNYANLLLTINRKEKEMIKKNNKAYFLSGLAYLLTCNIFAMTDFEIEKLEGEALRTAELSLNYVLKSQSLGDGKVFKGEWENYILLNKIKIPGRKEKKYLDSNLFVTSSIYDLLAEIYELNPQGQSKIFPHLELAIDSFKYYQTNRTYNFWPLIPKNIELQSYAEFSSLALGLYEAEEIGHRPSYFPLKSKFETNFTNIVNDADDTALAYRAIHRHRKYVKDTKQFDTLAPEASLFEIVDQYRDISRNTNHPYNSLVGNVRNSGAYLTWFGKESNAFNLTTKVIPLNKKSGIPFGVNDVDCVVNANILNTLAITNSLDKAKGADDACKLIKRAFYKKKSKTCGIYYPSEYTLHFTSSNAVKNGAKCLEDITHLIVKDILADQNENGSFVSKWHDSDTIQSTAYALASLLNILNKTNKDLLLPVIHKGISYLLSQSQIDENGDIFFHGGAFFSGGTVLRKKLIWVSDAYTTALISNLLFRFSHKLPH